MVLRCCFAVILFSALLSERALGAINLVCDSVQNQCPGDNEQRRCTCFSTGSILRWRSSDEQFFENGIAFDSSIAVGTNGTRNGFTVILTNNTAGYLTSIMVFAPSAIGNAGVVITCEESVGIAIEANLNVTDAGPPSQPVFITPVIKTCSSTGGNYRATVQWIIAGPVSVPLMNYTGSVSDGSTLLSTINSMSNTHTTEELSCSTDYMITIRANNCAGISNSSTLSLTTVLDTPTITQVCMSSGSLVVNWTPPVIPANSCYSVTSYTVTILNNLGETIAVNASGTASSAVVAVPNVSISHRVTVSANTECGSSTSNPLEMQSSEFESCTTVSPSVTLSPSSIPAVLSSTCQVALGVGIPLTFLLTATITALLASLITYLCLKRTRTKKYITRSAASSHKYTTPPMVATQEPSYDYIHHTAGSEGNEGTVRLERNVSYGEVGARTGNADNKYY